MLALPGGKVATAAETQFLRIASESAPGLRESFQASGLYHLLAVSGTNLTLVVGSLLGMIFGLWLALADGYTRRMSDTAQVLCAGRRCPALRCRSRCPVAIRRRSTPTSPSSTSAPSRISSADRSPRARRRSRGRSV